MNSKIEITAGTFGKKAIIKAEWEASLLQTLIANKVAELELNDGKGWRGSDLTFLESLPWLQSLTIIDLNIQSTGSVHSLNELKSLEIITYSKTPIEFLSFPKLEQCSFEWINGSDSLFEITSLRKLFINNYKGKDSRVFSSLVNLEELEILNSPISELEGISFLKELRSLRLANLKNIKSIQELEYLPQLEEFSVQRCKGISKVSGIFELRSLKRLLLLDLGDIESIVGIEKLCGLEDFMFYGSTNIRDGNLSSLSALSGLKRISFQNRRHYTHKREDFGIKYTQ